MNNFKVFFIGLRSAIASHQDFTFCALFSEIQVYSRQVLVKTFKVQELDASNEIGGLLVLGDLLLCFSSTVSIFNFKTLGKRFS